MWKIPREMTQLIERANEWMQAIQVEITHTIGESNMVADYITNLAYEHEGTMHFNNFQELPIRGKQPINNDKSEIPYIRVRNRRIQNDTISENH